MPESALAAAPVTVDETGTFSFASLFGPRVVRVARLPDDWVLRGVWLDDVEITDVPFDFRATEQPRTLRVVVSQARAGATGLVTGAGKRPAAAARVIAFAEDSRQWGVLSRFVKAVESGPDGRYAMQGLLPGAYRIVAVDDLDEGAWRDPDVLGRLMPLAAPVVVRESGLVAVPLTVRSWR